MQQTMLPTYLKEHEERYRTERAKDAFAVTVEEEGEGDGVEEAQERQGNAAARAGEDKGLGRFG